MSDTKPRVLTEVSGLERFLHRKMLLVVSEAMPQHTPASITGSRRAPTVTFRDVSSTPVIVRALRWYDTGAMSAVVQEVESGNMRSVALSAQGSRVVMLRSDASDLALLGEEAE
jgi:hypothetical protein